MEQAHLVTGRRGESIAVRFLKRIGYHILASNVRVDRDEIDIVAFDPEDAVIVFCEVKTRRDDHPDYRPELNITAIKRRRMARAARMWVGRYAWDGGYRMDVVCVAAGKVTEHWIEIPWRNMKRRV